MNPQLTLQTNTPPSYINKDSLLGGMAGLIIGGMALNSILPGAGFIAAAVGAIAGGVVGKARIEAENTTGKKVGDPSFWNKETAIGGLIGLAMAGLAAVAAGAITLGTAVAVGAGGPLVGGATLAALAAGFVAAPLASGFIGGKIGKNQQANEYEEAKHQTIVNHISKTVSPEAGKAMEYSLEHGKEWCKEAAESRLLAAAEGHHR